MKRKDKELIEKITLSSEGKSQRISSSEISEESKFQIGMDWFDYRHFDGVHKKKETIKNSRKRRK